MHMPRSAALHMSYTVSAATLTAVRASISTPVLPVVRAVASTSIQALDSPRRFRPAGGQLDAHVGQQQGVAHGDQLVGALGRLDAGDLGHGQHVALLGQAAFDERQRLGRHRDPAPGHRHALCLPLGPDVDHARAAALIQMREFARHNHGPRARIHENGAKPKDDPRNTKHAPHPLSRGSAQYPQRRFPNPKSLAANLGHGAVLGRLGLGQVMLLGLDLDGVGQQTSDLVVTGAGSKWSVQVDLPGRSSDRAGAGRRLSAAGGCRRCKSGRSGLR